MHSVILFLLCLNGVHGFRQLRGARDTLAVSTDHSVYSGEANLIGCGAWDSGLIGVDIDVVAAGAAAAPIAYASARSIRISLLYLPRGGESSASSSSSSSFGATRRAIDSSISPGAIVSACALLNAAVPWLDDIPACRSNDSGRNTAPRPWEMALGSGGALIHGGALRRDGSLGPSLYTLLSNTTISAQANHSMTHIASASEMSASALGTGRWVWGGGLLDWGGGRSGGSSSSSSNGGGGRATTATSAATKAFPHGIAISSSSIDVAPTPDLTPILGSRGGFFFGSFGMGGGDTTTGTMTLARHIARRATAWRRTAAPQSGEWLPLGLHLSFAPGSDGNSNDTRVAWIETAARGVGPSARVPVVDTDPTPPTHGTLLRFEPRVDEPETTIRAKKSSPPIQTPSVEKEAPTLACIAMASRGGRRIPKGDAFCAGLSASPGDTLLDLWLSPVALRGRGSSRASIQRTLIGPGLGRRLDIQMRASLSLALFTAVAAAATTTSSSSLNSNNKNCSIALTLTLPRGLYADLDELRAGTGNSTLFSFVPSFDIEKPAPVSSDGILFLLTKIYLSTPIANSSASLSWVDPAVSRNTWAMNAVLEPGGGGGVLTLNASLPLHVRYELPGCDKLVAEISSSSPPPPVAWYTAITNAWGSDVQVFADGFIRTTRNGRAGCFAPIFLPQPTAHISCSSSSSSSSSSSGGGGIWIPLPAATNAWPNAELFDANTTPIPDLTPVGNAQSARTIHRLSVSTVLSGILAIFAAAASAVWRASPSDAALVAQRLIRGRHASGVRSDFETAGQESKEGEGVGQSTFSLPLLPPTPSRTSAPSRITSTAAIHTQASPALIRSSRVTSQSPAALIRSPRATSRLSPTKMTTLSTPPERSRSTEARRRR